MITGWEIDWATLSAILATAAVTGTVTAGVTYFTTKRQADKHHKERMEFERKKWQVEQSEKNAPGLTDWNINP